LSAAGGEAKPGERKGGVSRRRKEGRKCFLFRGMLHDKENGRSGAGNGRRDHQSGSRGEA